MQLELFDQPASSIALKARSESPAGVSVVSDLSESVAPEPMSLASQHASMSQQQRQLEPVGEEDSHVVPAPEVLRKTFEQDGDNKSVKSAGGGRDVLDVVEESGCEGSC